MILVAGARSQLNLPRNASNKVQMVAGVRNHLILPEGQEAWYSNGSFRFDLLFNSYDITDVLKRTARS